MNVVFLALIITTLLTSCVPRSHIAKERFNAYQEAMEEANKQCTAIQNKLARIIQNQRKQITTKPTTLDPKQVAKQIEEQMKQGDSLITGKEPWQK